MYWEGHPDKLPSNATCNKNKNSVFSFQQMRNRIVHTIYLLAVSHFGFSLYLFALGPPLLLFTTVENYIQ